MQLISAMQEVFRDPVIPYEPQKHSLKAWAKFCLQHRGYKVIYADKADFALETRDRQKIYFNVTDQPEGLDDSMGWIIWDSASGSASVIAPQGS